MEKKKKNIFIRFFCAVGRAINYFFCFIIFAIAWVFAKIFFRCKVKGKENINKTDEAQIFISNHYELFGPIAMFLRFPKRFRPWIIDKMMIPECVEKQMGLMIYNNYKKVPKWIKAIIIAIIKNLMVFTMKYMARGIPVSRENFRENLKTMKITTDELKKGKTIVIFPEKDYVNEGVGEFQTGFEHIAKYYYQKTGKKITFYPTFISQVNRTIYIEKPITFNPDNDFNDEKDRIVNYLKTSMVDSYKQNEVGSKQYLKHKAKLEKREAKEKATAKSKEEKNNGSKEN